MNSIAKIQNLILDNKPFDDEINGYLEGLGFDDPDKVWKILQTLKGHVNFSKLYPDFFSKLLETSSQSYDAEQALVNFERFAEKILDKNYLYTIITNSTELFQALITLFSGSQVLTDTLLKSPSHFDWLNQPETLGQKKSKDVLYRDYHSLAGTEVLTDKTPSLLRQFKKREYIRIGLRDLLGDVSVEETVGDLANLADICLQVAYEYAEKILKGKHGTPYEKTYEGIEKEAEFTVLSMGKLGGKELNFSSDIDLIYIYSSSQGETKASDDEATGIRTLSNHEYFCKLALLLTKTIHEITGEGNVFRVDLDLRPEGKSGEITNSLASCETYYQSWGRTWERQALIKARVSAGSDELGKEFFSMIEPFIFRRSLDFAAIDEIKSLKRKIDEDLKKRNVEKGNIKLGAGGIREIEFIVQAYQLIFGGREKSLRVPNTLITLQRLREMHFIDEEERSKLQKAYIFLRRLENMVQISFGLQTHILPKDENNLAILAKKMKVKEKEKKQLVARLMEKFATHTQFVEKKFSRLFAEDKDQKKADDTSREWETRRMSESQFTIELFKGGRFSNPERTYRFLISLRDGPQFSHPTEKSIQDFYSILPKILEISEEVPNPNSAIENLVKFVEASQARETFMELFDNNQKLLELLMILFGSSEVLSGIVVKQPALMDVLMNAESLYRFKPERKMKAEMEMSLAECLDLQSKILFLRKYKHGEELRIGMRYLIKEADLQGTLADLASLADVFLQIVLSIAHEECGKEAGLTESPLNDFAIIAMGKLGGRELNFGSDLDVVFVCDESEDESLKISKEEVISHYASVSQMIYKLTSQMTPAGIAYKIDTDLRPEGSGGSLVTSLKGYKNYFKTRARVWEKQAMTRARFVAGNPELGEKFKEMVNEYVYQSKLDNNSLVEISRLRTRMEKELAQEDKKGKNVKLGFGGLADIEFLTQILQLMHGGRNPKLRISNTIDALEALSINGFIDYDQCNQMKKNYLFLRNLECALRLRSEKSENHLPKDNEKIAQLARLLSYQEKKTDVLAEKIMKDYENSTKQVREIYSANLTTLLRSAR
ncbi:MAG: bifunctional [glutamate--ammonia ligase]-adenylyl-L-tyrosine phosphorylase/[glutamate--ammonia-ligase] adenylyltransferase [Nitrospinales bacterium]